MADVLKTAVEWLRVSPYNSIFAESFDGWDRKNLQDFNTKPISEEEFRTKLKASNQIVPEEKYVATKES